MIARESQSFEPRPTLPTKITLSFNVQHAFDRYCLEGYMMQTSTDRMTARAVRALENTDVMILPYHVLTSGVLTGEFRNDGRHHRPGLRGGGGLTLTRTRMLADLLRLSDEALVGDDH